MSNVWYAQMLFIQPHFFFATMFVFVKENEVKSYFNETTLTVNIGQRCGSEN